MYFTYHPIEWENFIKYHIGEEEYNELRRMALAYEKIDYQAIIEGLIGQLTLGAWQGNVSVVFYS